MVLSLLLLALEAGLAGALRHHPYTAHAPKKLFLQRTLRHGPDVPGFRASWDAAAIDSVPASAALPGEVAARAAAAAPGTWLALFPVSNVLQARLEALCHISQEVLGKLLHSVERVCGWSCRPTVSRKQEQTVGAATCH